MVNSDRLVQSKLLSSRLDDFAGFIGDPPWKRGIDLQGVGGLFRRWTVFDLLGLNQVDFEGRLFLSVGFVVVRWTQDRWPRSEMCLPSINRQWCDSPH